MPVLHVALDIDSDVYPELHAKLASLQRPEARAERLRQLAASGLVWETVRIHGPAAFQLPAPDPTPLPPTVAEERAARSPAPRATARPPAPTRAPRPAAERNRPTDFVDLAISVEPPAPPPDPPPKAAGRKAAAHERPPVPDHVPLLLDVVSSPVLPDPAFAAPAPPFDDGVLEPAAPEPAQPLTVVHRSAPRSRLLRMKERGLFKNG